jgi:hypothetical protein
VVGTVVLEELLFVRIIIGTVAETLRQRSVEPVPAVAAGVVASPLCYAGLEAVFIASGPFRFDPATLLPTALISLLFATGYLLTGELALPIGLHLGGALAFNSLYQIPFESGLTLPSVVVVDPLAFDQSVTYSLRLQAVRLLVGVVLVGFWIYVFYGEFDIDERVYEIEQ